MYRPLPHAKQSSTRTSLLSRPTTNVTESPDPASSNPLRVTLTWSTLYTPACPPWWRKTRPSRATYRIGAAGDPTASTATPLPWRSTTTPPGVSARTVVYPAAADPDGGRTLLVNTAWRAYVPFLATSVSPAFIAW